MTSEQSGNGFDNKPIDPVTGQPYERPTVPQASGGPPAGGGAYGWSSRDYPVRFDVEYPDRQLNRLTTFFRAFTVIPIAMIYLALMGSFYGTYLSTWSDELAVADFTGWFAPMVVPPVILMLLFRGRYPRWWFDWNLEVARLCNRITAYALLMDDRYPSTDEQQAVKLEIDYPDAPLNRFLPLVKWLLAMPHFIVLSFYAIGVFVATVWAWFAILFTGRYPRWAFDLNRNFLRWSMRVTAYALLLTTDRYPPFSADE